ncbi:uncharacterized protein LOC114391587 [Glycine soja]|uniref:uncharacterized protein n=1 Tax=Glycine max TaxID=3847 RepID=UPI0003DED814|nr:uncharacterized protein LOC102666551 [Glycine max]XP_028208379.1 uncharacterized protein LOC114391587 [Glycine soja]|eukprot:XP_006601553.1 uncharacterized protein LOC102666551 [Glycine max]
MSSSEVATSDYLTQVIVFTPTDKLVTTSIACLDCSMIINDKTFSVNLICLPLSHLNVVLGMDWLSSNHDLLNYKNKILTFGACAQDILGSSSLEISRVSEAKKVENVKAFMVLFSSTTEESLDVRRLPIVYEFPEVFPEDVTELPPERELEFAIDLVLGCSPVLVVPY